MRLNSQVRNLNITPPFFQVFRHQPAVAVVRLVLATEERSSLKRVVGDNLLDVAI